MQLYYKHICKRIRRLPIDEYTYSKLLTHTKQEFLNRLKSFNYSGKPVDVKKYNALVNLLDEILIYEDWHKLHAVLDYIHKDVSGPLVYPKQYKALKQFNNLNYNQVRNSFPQTHLFKLLSVPQQYISRFDKLLADEALQFSLSKFFNTKTDISIPLIQRPSVKSDFSETLNEIKKMYDFVKGKKQITHLKLKPIEAAYPSNKYGLPLHIKQRDRILHQQLTSIKSIIKDLRPIPKESLDAMSQFVYQVETGKSHFNPSFFRYMKRKRDKPIDFKLKGGKKVIPDERNLVKLYKDYLTKQYYYDTNMKAYKTSQVKFYS